jgi:DNA repair exonuclease SbcCD ATPase subunit
LEDKNIAASYKGHQALVTQRVQIQAKITVKQGEVTQRLTLVNREKGHKYDPNCKFCIDNAGNIITDARSAAQELEKDKITAAELVSQLNAINTKISENEWAVKEYENYTQLLSTRNKVKNLIIRHNTGLNRLREILKHNQTGLAKIEQDIVRYEENKNALVANEEVNKRIQVIRLELSNVETLLKAKNKTLMDLNGKVATFKSQIDTINKKMEEAKKTETEYKVYEIYTQAVCRDGIPFNVITMTVPEIEREVNSILSQISEFSAKFETDGKNIVPYIVYDDKKWLMSLTSGMEKFTLSLAIRVALINISNLPRPNFLIIDEGFGVLDAENLACMQTLFNFLKTNFDFILVISHLEALRDMVDTQLELTKDNGFSKVNFV